jgi:hypothetical protein
MSKSTITRLFIGGGIAIVAGAALAIFGIWLAIENDAFILSGTDIVGLHGGGFAWTGLGLGLAGALVFTGGMIGGFVSWIGALTNTWALDSKTWFTVLLLLGIFNLGFFAMVAYLIAGPDGTTAGTARRHASATAAA